jgi:glycosyltransferase involved in cell wall biosynthesis
MIRAEYFMREPRIAHSPKLIRKPEVSIMLPTYCRGDNGLLKRSIESVLSQTFSSFELIVMDDGSTDGTADLVSAYVKADERIIHVRHDGNCGLPALRVNEALLMARGDICAYQFDDDQWTANYLEKVAGALQRSPDFEVAYGLCKSTYDGFPHLLGGPFNYAQLLAGNYIANNTLLHRRSVFERLGGYDMHLVMRRLCDWDLWLRWGREAAFLSVYDEVVSIVEGGLAESLGKTVALDGLLTRAQMALNRNESLRPGALKSYVIDDLDHLEHLGQSKMDGVWRQQVAPYQSRFRHIWTAVRPPSAKRLHVLVVKGHFDTTIDITVGNCAQVLADDYVFTFMPLVQTGEAAISCSDILLLHRAGDQHAEYLGGIARRQGKPVVFLIDDELTDLRSGAEELSNLEPHKFCQPSLESIVREADFVITYSNLIRESIQRLNARNVVLSANIPRKWLEDSKSKLDAPTGTSKAGESPVRIGVFAGGPRQNLIVWPAIVQASRRLGTRAVFKFWDFTPEALEELQSPYRCELFTQQDAAGTEFERALQPSRELSIFSYHQYVSRFTSSGFDVLIAPTFAGEDAKCAKCLTKFLEITAAGAVGVYVDVEPYSMVADGVSGIKCQNTVESLGAAIMKAATLLPSERDRLIGNAIRAIERDYTSEVQAPRVAAALEAAVLHGLLKKNSLGKPTIAYFCHSPYLAGAENNLLRHATLAHEFQFEPFLVFPSISKNMDEEIQRRATSLGIAIAYLPLTVETEADVPRQLDDAATAEIRRWLRQHRISLVHSVTLMREVGEAARSLSIPHAASLYATNSQHPSGFHHCDVVHSDSFVYANRWGDVLDTPVRRIMSYVPDEYFDVRPSPVASDGNLTVGIFGTLQPRKGQLQAVEAVGFLKSQLGLSIRLQLYGYDHFYPDYLEACKDTAERYGVSDLVSFPGFVTDHAAALRNVDVLLCASDWESIPLTVLEAMASGRLVIAPNVGGIGEIVSARTGILMVDNTPSSICRAFATALKLTADEWKNKTTLAREVIREECSKYKVATELFRLYRQAITFHSTDSKANCSQRERVTTGAQPPAESVLEALEVLRSRLHEINACFTSRPNGAA